MDKQKFSSKMEVENCLLTQDLLFEQAKPFSKKAQNLCDITQYVCVCVCGECKVTKFINILAMNFVTLKRQYLISQTFLYHYEVFYHFRLRMTKKKFRAQFDFHLHKFF
jgi:hypothetical protein